MAGTSHWESDMPSEKREGIMDRTSRNQLYREIIEGYIGAYNRFDIEGMLLNVDRGVIFENISGGSVDLHTDGIEELRQQAEDSKNSFSRRKQVITGITYRDEQVEVGINFCGTLAIDLPGGMKAGQKIELKGKTIFKFKNDRIIGIADIS